MRGHRVNRLGRCIRCSRKGCLRRLGIDRRNFYQVSDTSVSRHRNAETPEGRKDQIAENRVADRSKRRQVSVLRPLWHYLFSGNRTSVVNF